MQRLQSALRRPQNLDAPRRPLRLRRARWIAMIIAAAVLISTGGTTAAWSLWSQQITLSATVTAGTVVAPESLTCKSKMVLPIVGPAYVTLTWPAAPDATEYAVSLRNADATEVLELGTTNAATRSFDINAQLLNGLLGSLVALLLGGETVDAYVETIHASGWRSAPSPVQGIKSSGLISGLLGGVACA